MIFGNGSDDSDEHQEEKWNSDGHCSSEALQEHLKNHFENYSSEKLEEKYMSKNIESNGTDLICLNKTARKDYCRALGASDDEVTNFEREVKDMIKAAKKFQKMLSLDEGICDFFGSETTGQLEVHKAIQGEKNDVRASFEQMEKMDAILRVKAAEERKAKLCRIQAEEESRNILSGLPQIELSNGLKINMEEFIRLLNDTEETECDASCLQNLEETEEVKGEEKNKENGPKEKKILKTNGERRKTKNFKFIEKNIQLAKCGRGTLSMTDEEKFRVETLLTEADDGDDVEASKSPSALTKDLYAFDGETKSVLSRIDQRLEAVAKVRSPQQSARTESLLEKLASEENVCEKAGKTEGDQKKRWGGRRLADIDRLLDRINSVCQEEIMPPSEEEIESLLEESKREEIACEEIGGGDRRSEREGEEGADAAATPSVRCSGDVICDLVSNAKLLMPKFKYRFDVS